MPASHCGLWGRTVGRSASREAEDADRHRAGRQCAAAPQRPDDHRGATAQHHGGGPGDRPAGHRAQRCRRARERATGRPAVPAGRGVLRRRALSARRPGRGHPGHDRLPDPAGAQEPPATGEPGGDPAHHDRGGPGRPGVRQPDEVRRPRLHQGGGRRAGRRQGLGVPAGRCRVAAGGAIARAAAHPGDRADQLAARAGGRGHLRGRRGHPHHVPVVGWARWWASRR